MSPFYIIVAATEKELGIGIGGKLPWRLRREMAHFTRMTTMVSDPEKTNAIIMGRKTFMSIPKQFRPLKARFNIVLSTALDNNFSSEVEVCSSLEVALKVLEKPARKEVLDKVWIIGGSSVFKECLKKDICDKIYITLIKKDFECDTFFPKIPDKFHLINDKNVSQELQLEDGIEYEYKVYERIKGEKSDSEKSDSEKSE